MMNLIVGVLIGLYLALSMIALFFAFQARKKAGRSESWMDEALERAHRAVSRRQVLD